MPDLDLTLRGDHIALCDLLKLAGIADSGGQAKMLIADGQARVDGAVETRKTAKIRAHQVVACLGQTVRVLPAPDAA